MIGTLVDTENLILSRHGSLASLVVFIIVWFTVVVIWLCMWGFLSYDTVVLQMNREKLMKMASAVRTGGKGSVRRSVHPVRIGYIFCYKTLL